MRIALIADSFPPMRTSSAVQLRDLTREFVRQGHDFTVILPDANLNKPWELETYSGADVLRLRAPRTKDVGYLRRTLSELVMPIVMRNNLRKSPSGDHKWDGIVWYSPSIFHGPLVRALKEQSSCKAYLIIRDIFPEWAVDMGLMGRGLPYRFFDAVAKYQYSQAEVIGVQTKGNLSYFEAWRRSTGRETEVLPNWLDAPGRAPSSIQISHTALAGRKVFVYAGNIGVAQGLDIVIDLAEHFGSREDVGFLIVGRGSEKDRIKREAKERQLDNILFFDEIHPDEIPALYAQCHAGIVALDARHKSHNIPGKFLTYVQSGLPVLANVNAGNDLAAMIRSEQVGTVSEENDIDDLILQAETLLKMIEADADISRRCRALFETNFSSAPIVQQIVRALQ